MADRIKCQACKNMILQITAEKNNGLCAPCLHKSNSPENLPKVFTGKFDDASWHYGGEFPSDLPNSAGATHIGMYVASMLLNGMGGELYREQRFSEMQHLVNQEITPGQWIIETCDEKFTEEELNSEGNEFTHDYYFPDDSLYLHDYEKSLCKGLASAYHVPDTWRSFRKIDRLIKKRLHKWRRTTRANKSA